MTANSSGLWVAFLLAFVSVPTSSQTLYRNRCARELLPTVNRTEIASMIRFRDYNGSTLDEFVERSGNSLVMIDAKRDEERFGPRSKAKSLIVYIHGYRESPTSESVRTVMEAYLKRASDRYVVVDWGCLVSGNYGTAVSRVAEVARVLAMFLKMMHSLLDVASIHLVGHSLGAQVAGLVRRYTDFDIARVTGLDPANPGFYHPGADHISSASATFVDVVHTDGGFYGALEPTGTVDFYANGGKRPQPGCAMISWPLTSDNLCSHQASWRYYARTIADEDVFPALRCSSFVDLVLGQCKRDGPVFFGDKTSTDIRGIYYFATRSK